MPIKRKTMEYTQRFKHWLERNNWKDYAHKSKFDRAEIAELVADPTIDHGIVECGLPAYTDKQYDKVFAEASMARAKSENMEAPNFIVDVIVVHTDSGLGMISESQAISAVQSLHDSFRNQGPMYDPRAIDTGINFGLGEIIYVNGTQEWGEDWDTYGIRFSGTNGIYAPTVMAAGKSKIGAVGDGSRFAICTYHKISGAFAAGFAWVGVSATSSLAGAFCNVVQVGHIGYRKDNEPWYGSAHNKTTIHEVGHSLGLWHTFHNTSSCDETNPLIQGDKIADTAVEWRSGGSECFNTNPNNHLSYSSHTNRVLFTPGQAERMADVIAVRYPLMYGNPPYNWDDTVEPPAPPAPPPLELKIEDFTAEIIDADHRIVRISADVHNADVISLTASNDDGTAEQDVIIDYGNDPQPNSLISKVDFGESLTDPISGLTYTGNSVPYEDEDGAGLLFGVDSGNMLTLEGLEHSDYTYRIKCKFTEKIGNVQSIISKRIHHQGNQSFFFIFTWNANALHWDNTTNNNRRVTLFIPKLGDLLDIVVSRNHGMWINGEKVAEAGNYDSELVNTAPLRIGNDHTTSGRGMGGVVYSVEVHDKSLTPDDFTDDGDDGENPEPPEPPSPPEPPTDVQPFIINTRSQMAKGKWQNGIATWMKQHLSFRIPAGSQSQWTWLREEHVPQEVIDNGTLNKQVYIDRQMMMEMGVALKDYRQPVYFCVNINDTIENQVQMLREFRMAGVNITHVEIGNETYLPKFRNGDRPTAPGYVRVISADDYAEMVPLWIDAIKAEFPEMKFLINVASVTGNASRDAWNDRMLELIGTEDRIDGVVVHIYVNKNLTDDEEEATDFNFKTMDIWPLPIHITESGDQSVDYTQEGLDRYTSFYTQLQTYLDSRGDGSVNGAHCLMAVANTTNHYGSLYLQGQETPLANELKQFLGV